MRKLTLVIVAMIFVVSAVVSQEITASQRGIIAKVKRTVLAPGTESNPGGVTIEEVVNNIAGARSTITWTVFKPDKEKNQDIIIVEAELNKTDGEKVHRFFLQYLFNKKTEIVQQGYIGFDGGDSEGWVIAIMEYMFLDF